jgi:hypothetical protein
MAVDAYSRPSYNDVIDSLQAELSLPELKPKFQSQTELLKMWILHACQDICDKIPIREERDLLLIIDQEDYIFKNDTEPTNGTGTIDSDGVNISGVVNSGTGTISTESTTVTGVGTSFISELAIGKAIKVGTDIREIKSIESNTQATLYTSFDSDIPSGSTFDISTTRFTQELIEGSIIVSSSQTRTISSITDPMNATVTAPFNPDLSGETFTIDKVYTQLPTRFNRIYKAQYDYGGYIVNPDIVDINEILDQKERDGLNSSMYALAPIKLAEWVNSSGQRYLKVYPTPNEHRVIKIIGDIKIKPRQYDSVDLDTAIPLTEDYEPLIRAYVKSKIYEVFSNSLELATMNLTTYRMLIDSFILNIPHTQKTKIVYRG